MRALEAVLCVNFWDLYILIILTYRVSEREKLDYVYKKKLYQLAVEHEKVNDGLLLDGVNWSVLICV